MTDLLTRTRWTVDDLTRLPDDDGVRYEIIDGELLMASAPHSQHQDVIGNIYLELRLWSDASGLGRPTLGPGIIFDDGNAVIPDLIWMSYERRAAYLDRAGHWTAAPELMVEVLSAGWENERRDRELKLDLYARWDVQEYWIVDWRTQQVAVYRRAGITLSQAATLDVGQELTSPLLPGFSCAVARLFA